MSELRECPFCASTQLAAKDDPNQGYKWGAITCLSCSATGPEVRTGYDKPEKWRPQAIEEWNHRASPSSGVDVDVASRAIDNAILLASVYDGVAIDKDKVIADLAALHRALTRETGGA